MCILVKSITAGLLLIQCRATDTRANLLDRATRMSDGTEKLFLAKTQRDAKTTSQSIPLN